MIKDKKDFSGFSKKALTFLSGLEKNNNKGWFDSNRAEYRENILEPMKEFVFVLGSVMSKKLKGLNYNPSVNGSIFRINRDTRFSKDKRPYKTHTAAFLWVGTRKKLECPGIYFHFDAKTLMLGSGVYIFSPETINCFRKYVADHGASLSRSITKAEKAGFELGGEKLKRVPIGFQRDHKWAELLKMKGLYMGRNYPSSEITKSGLIEWLNTEYAPTLSLIRELEKSLIRVENG